LSFGSPLVWAVAEPYPEDQDEMWTECGWVDAEGDALASAQVVMDRLAGGEPFQAVLMHGFATDELKRVNAERRRNRPAPDTDEVRPVEYLYGHDTMECGRGVEPCSCYELPAREAWQHHLVPFRITKKTARRIYYVRHEPHRDGQVFVGGDLEIGFVDRQKFEADGKVRRKGAGWWVADSTLYATTDPPEWWRPGRPAEPELELELSRLRVEMADAHPDRGGTAEGFMEARRRYLQAKGLVR
jgi:hypothetical protein